MLYNTASHPITPYYPLTYGTIIVYLLIVCPLDHNVHFLGSEPLSFQNCCSLLNSQLLEQVLAHIRCSINIWRMNEWTKSKARRKNEHMYLGICKKPRRIEVQRMRRGSGRSWAGWRASLCRAWEVWEGIGFYLQREAISRVLGREVTQWDFDFRYGEEGRRQTGSQGTLWRGIVAQQRMFQDLHQHWEGRQDKGTPSLGLTPHRAHSLWMGS